MNQPDISAHASAAEDFRHARRQAALQTIMAQLTGRSAGLFSFNEVQQKLKVSAGTDMGQQEIPLDAIVGSVGRYDDFTRGFLPQNAKDMERWAGVKAAVSSGKRLPPIEVYQIDQAYFVLDGNHRVSVARQMGASHIEAHVIRCATNVSLSPDDSPDDLIIKAEYADFLERTHFDKIRPQANLIVTAAGQYWELETHLEAHRFLLSKQKKQEIPFEQAAADWYDQVYEPAVEQIHKQGLLRDFPNRTELDIYLWLFRHRTILYQKLGWQVDLDATATDLAMAYSSKRHRVVTRIRKKLHKLLTPPAFDGGPSPGQWRHERLNGRRTETLFADILVPINGETAGWYALDMALEVAHYEHSHILGLYVVALKDQIGSSAVKKIKDEFEQRCQAAGVSGELAVEAGNVVATIRERAHWADLVIMYPANPPGLKFVSRLTSGSRNVIYGSCRPVLTVPGPVSQPQRILLAYDGSPKAQEGLYISTYLVGHWGMWLVVMTVIENTEDTGKLDQARCYLDSHGITATYLPREGNVAKTILTTAEQQDSDLIIIGGYGVRPFHEAILGSKVDRILRETHRSVLVCR